MELFRYRKYDIAKTEIKNHTFRFSDRESLNDPIEGYVRLYWQGDYIAWEALLRNYIHNLYWALLEFSMYGNDKMSINVDLIDFNDKNPQLFENFKEIELEFFGISEIKKIIEILGKNEKQYSKKEVICLLCFMHTKCLEICISNQIKHELLPKVLEEYVRILREKNFLDVIIKTLDKFSDERIREQIFEEIESIWTNICDCAIGGMRNEKGEQRWKWLSLHSQFPKLYVDYLEQLIHPEQYVVCFSETSNNSVMWGNYADHHKGICMIFETEEKNSKDVMAINCSCSSSNSGINHKFNDMEVKSIKYDDNCCNINFFNMLGRLTVKQLSIYLTNSEGDKSVYWNDYFYKDNQWRENYWRECNDRYLHKMSEWSYEKEYRLLLTDFLHDFSEPDSRTLEFDFKQLKGIIFGIKTPQKERWEMIELIKNECKKVNREEFLFYQAEYCERARCIKKRRIYV